MASLNDFMATFAELTDVKLGYDEAPDSISFAKLLRNPEGKGTRQNLIMQSVVPFVVRDGSWKLCLCPSSGMPADSENGAGNEPSPNDAWRMALDKVSGKPTESELLQAPFVQLFNLANDPHEDNNLAADYPERVRDMVALLKEQIESGRSTLGPKLKNDISIKMINPMEKRLPDFVRDIF